MPKRYSEEKIIDILREAKANGTVVRDLCRKYEIPEQTFYRWRNKYGGLSVLEVRMLREEAEQVRLRKIAAKR